MFSVIFPGQGSQLVGMGKDLFDKYNLVKNIGLGHQNAAHTKSYFKYLIMTPNVRLSYLQSKRLKFKEISISFATFSKFLPF